jgi:hypothetical protein
VHTTWRPISPIIGPIVSKFSKRAPKNSPPKKKKKKRKREILGIPKTHVGYI